jgi:hypothetical protein
MSAAADARLLALCADLEERDRQRLQLDRDFEAGHDHTNEELAAVQIPWWDALDRVAGTAARTPEGVLAKAAAVRTGFVGVYGSTSSRVIALLASLLTDMLGEPVRLPGAEDGDGA